MNIMAAGEKSISELLREVANRLDSTSSPQPERVLQLRDEAVSGRSSHHNSTTLTLPTASSTTASSTSTATTSSMQRNAVQAEVARLFAPYRGRLSSSPLTPPSSKKACRAIYTHTFFCLNDHMSDTVPAKAVKFELAAAGLGEKRISFQGRDDDPEIVKGQIENTFPQLKDTGGFELLRISGTTQSRSLCTIPSPDRGYTVQYLRSPMCGIGQALIYIRPLQKSIALEDSQTTLQQHGPLTKCLNCDTNIPLNKMKNHIIKCTSSLSGAEPQPITESQARQALSSTTDADVPSCSSSVPRNMSSRTEELDVILESTIGSARAEQSSGEVEVQDDAPADPDGKKSLVGEKPEWKCEQEPTKAAWLYKSDLLLQYESRKAVVLQMDLWESIEDQERLLISFYKAPKVEWAGPVSCKLQGDVAVGEGVKRFIFSKAISLVHSGFHLNLGNMGITRLFDGEPDHLTPSTSLTLLESDMFLVAGRMMGHSFIHGGPCVSGISSAIIHVLLGGSPEMATIQLEDCPDFDIRSIIQLLDGSAELAEQEKSNILELALSWDLPDVTQSNRKWLHERLLFHAVITRTSCQVKQLRKGLKETMVWPLLTERTDIIPLFFPRESETAPSCESILEGIVWPAIDDDDEEDEDECPLEDQCRVTGYLRSFIENASCAQRKALLKFWTGWEVLPREMTVEVVNSNLLKSSTCFEVLRLPMHYNTYESFLTDFQVCLNSSDSGFGLV